MFLVMKPARESLSSRLVIGARIFLSFVCEHLDCTAFKKHEYDTPNMSAEHLTIERDRISNELQAMLLFAHKHVTVYLQR